MVENSSVDELGTQGTFNLYSMVKGREKALAKAASKDE